MEKEAINILVKELGIPRTTIIGWIGRDGWRSNMIDATLASIEMKKEGEKEIEDIGITEEEKEILCAALTKKGRAVWKKEAILNKEILNYIGYNNIDDRAIRTAKSLINKIKHISIAGRYALVLGCRRRLR